MIKMTNRFRRCYMYLFGFPKLIYFTYLMVTIQDHIGITFSIHIGYVTPFNFQKCITNTFV